MSNITQSADIVNKHGYRLYSPILNAIDTYLLGKRVDINTTSRLLVAYRMFPIPFKDEDGNDTGDLLFSYDIIARIAGKEVEAANGNFSSREIIRLYKKIFPEDEIMEHRYFEGIYQVARRIKPAPLPKILEDEMDHLLDGDYDKEQTINVLDGRIWTTAKKNALRQQVKIVSQQEIERARSPEQKDVISYLNNQGSRIHSDVEKCIPEMRKARPKHINKGAVAGMLLDISDIAQQQYRISENTARLIPSNTGLATIPKDMRRAATRRLGWYEFDLRNAGLAIAAMLYRDEYGVREEIIPLLESGVNIWKLILDEFGVEYNDTNKKTVKRAINRILHGGDFSIVYKDITKTFKGGDYTPSPKETETTWMIFCCIGLAVEKNKARIKQNKGIKLHSGQWVELQSKEIRSKSKYNKTKTYVSGRTYNYGKLLAQQIHDIELLLVHPAFILARDNTRKFAITLYQYDGFNVKFYGEDDYWKQRIIDTVNSNALAMGCPTELVIKDE